MSHIIFSLLLSFKMQENLCKLLYSILLIAQHHYITVTEFFNESLPTCTEQLLNGCVFESGQL